ncbi:MAG: hypothetical protein U0521_01445 [Anaerolineae bacterium]
MLRHTRPSMRTCSTELDGSCSGFCAAPAPPPRWRLAATFFLFASATIGLAALVFDNDTQQMELVRIIPSGVLLFFASVLYSPVYFRYLARALCRNDCGSDNRAGRHRRPAALKQTAYFDWHRMLFISILYGLTIAVLFIVARWAVLGEFIGVGATLGALIIVAIASTPVPYIIQFLAAPPPAALLSLRPVRAEPQHHAHHPAVGEPVRHLRLYVRPASGGADQRHTHGRFPPFTSR